MSLGRGEGLAGRLHDSSRGTVGVIVNVLAGVVAGHGAEDGDEVAGHDALVDLPVQVVGHVAKPQRCPLPRLRPGTAGCHRLDDGFAVDSLRMNDLLEVP